MHSFPRTSPFLAALLRATLPLVVLGHLAVASCAQKPKPIPPDPEVAAKVKELAAVAKDRKFLLDAKGVQIIDLLIQKQQKGLNPKDEKAIVKALDKLLNKARRRPANRAHIYVAAAHALGRFGEAGADVLQKAYDGKHFPDKPAWVPLREKLLDNIGRTKDESKVKFLIDEARRNPEAALQAAAGRALGNFEDASEKLRKQIVGDLLVRYGSVSEKASLIGTNIEAQNAKDRLAAITEPWNDTLKKLTRQQFDSFREWQSWHNKNKHKKW
ncbi:MAG TPA: hypothetical protein ENI87_10485 [bacterium]|nr:hypothetical protein [bacterium]